MDMSDMLHGDEYRCNCKVCGKEFIVDRAWQAKKRVLCGSEKCSREDRRLAMQRYRATEEGRAAVKLQNLRYKRPEVEKQCGVCGEVFKTARNNRYICDKAECQGRGKYIRIKKYREKNLVKNRARDVISKRVSRNKTMQRAGCLFCGNEKAEAHHHNYRNPVDVNFLCKTHHTELHSWDSN